MLQKWNGRPDTLSICTLPDGREAALISLDEKHFVSLQNGYPLSEEFLEDLARRDVNAVAIDGCEAIYAFDLSQYRYGARVGHAPYPMKRIADIDEAKKFQKGAVDLTDGHDRGGIKGHDIATPSKAHGRGNGNRRSR